MQERDEGVTWNPWWECKPVSVDLLKLRDNQRAWLVDTSCGAKSSQRCGMCWINLNIQTHQTPYFFGPRLNSCLDKAVICLWLVLSSRRQITTSAYLECWWILASQPVKSCQELSRAGPASNWDVNRCKLMYRQYVNTSINTLHRALHRVAVSPEIPGAAEQTSCQCSLCPNSRAPAACWGFPSSHHVTQLADLTGLTENSHWKYRIIYYIKII